MHADCSSPSTTATDQPAWLESDNAAKHQHQGLHAGWKLLMRGCDALDLWQGSHKCFALLGTKVPHTNETMKQHEQGLGMMELLLLMDRSTLVA
jgi:hypothetical protein